MARQRGYRFWPRSGRIRTPMLVLLVLTLVISASPIVKIQGAPVGPAAPLAAAKNAGKHKTKSAAAAAQSSACQFKKSGSTWKLQSNCTITSPINIPNGVTLDGNGKTITMTGPVANYRQVVPDNWKVDAAILANGARANVRDLKLKGSGLTGTCSSPFDFPPVPGDLPEGIAFINASGTIEKVTVTDVRLDGAYSCGVGISATGTGGQRVTVDGAAVSGSTTQALWGLAREGTAGITVAIRSSRVTMIPVPGGFFAGVGSGVRFSGPVSGSVEKSSIDVRDEDATGIALGIRGSSVARRVAIDDTDVTGVWGTGLFAAGTPGADLVIDVNDSIFDSSADPSLLSTTGMFLNGRFTVHVANTTVRDASLYGIYYEGQGARGVIENSVIEGSMLGLEAAFRSQVTVDDSTIKNVQFAASVDEESTLNVLDTRITGRGPSPEQSWGLLYTSGSNGRIDDAAISNFFDTNPDTVSCGVGLYEAGAVDIDDVSYPHPGNEQNFCDPIDFGFAGVAERSSSPSALDSPVPPGAESVDISAGRDVASGGGNDQTLATNAGGKDGKHRDRDKDRQRGKRGKH